MEISFKALTKVISIIVAVLVIFVSVNRFRNIAQYNIIISIDFMLRWKFELKLVFWLCSCFLLNLNSDTLLRILSYLDRKLEEDSIAFCLENFT